MKHIVYALRTTYHNERKAWSGLNDLINMLDESNNGCERMKLLRDIEDVIGDIQEDSQ